MIVAFVHSQGYVIDKQFHCLEFAYSDVLKRRQHLLVRSPFTYGELKSRHPKLPVTVSINPPSMTVTEKQVVEFLRARYKDLQAHYPDERLIFAYKGESYQSGVLRDAGIRDVCNVETLGVPSIERLSEMYPDETRVCTFHPGREKRCAERTTRLVDRYMADNAELIKENFEKLF